MLDIEQRRAAPVHIELVPAGWRKLDAGKTLPLNRFAAESGLPHTPCHMEKWAGRFTRLNYCGKFRGLN